jgi:hypothetical protein
MWVTSRAETVYLSRAHEFTPDVSGPLVEQKLFTYLEHLGKQFLLY